MEGGIKKRTLAHNGGEIIMKVTKAVWERINIPVV